MSDEHPHPNELNENEEETVVLEDEIEIAVDTTADEIAESEEEQEIPVIVQLEQAEARAEDYLESLKRERASFQNYKKRVEQERTEQQQRITGQVLLKLLPILDDFHRAMETVPQNERDTWYEGVLLIQRKLERFLVDQNVNEIEALGQPFDPNFHEAIGVDPDADAESGTVTLVLQRGYKQGNRVLRPALVRVAE